MLFQFLIIECYIIFILLLVNLFIKSISKASFFLLSVRHIFFIVFRVRVTIFNSIRIYGEKLYNLKILNRGDFYYEYDVLSPTLEISKCFIPHFKNVKNIKKDITLRCSCWKLTFHQSFKMSILITYIHAVLSL